MQAYQEKPPTDSELVMWAIRMLRMEHLHIHPIAVAHVARVPLDTAIAEMNAFDAMGWQIYTYYPDVPDNCIVMIKPQEVRQ